MGRWRITFEGTGPHHGPPIQHPDDAEKLGRLFLADLFRHGQHVHAAHFERIEDDPRIERLSLPESESASRLMDAGVSDRLTRRGLAP